MKYLKMDNLEEVKKRAGTAITQKELEEMRKDEMMNPLKRAGDATGRFNAKVLSGGSGSVVDATSRGLKKAGEAVNKLNKKVVSPAGKALKVADALRRKFAGRK